MIKRIALALALAVTLGLGVGELPAQAMHAPDPWSAKASDAVADELPNAVYDAPYTCDRVYAKLVGRNGLAYLLASGWLLQVPPHMGNEDALLVAWGC